jgi:hypothetical protein
MTRFVTLLAIFGLWTMESADISLAEVGLIQHRDGTAGTITHLGDDISIHSDSHGNTGPATSSGGNSPSFNGPHEDTQSGLVTPFGTPAPPNNLTPAPVLPFHPNRPPVPPQPSAPSSTTPPGLGSSNGGRFGR